jgi:hypothetical protein
MTKRLSISRRAAMVRGTGQTAPAVESQAEFIETAKAAHREMMASGLGFDADEVHAYIAARIAGECPSRPKGKIWRS